MPHSSAVQVYRWLKGYVIDILFKRFNVFLAECDRQYWYTKNAKDLKVRSLSFDFQFQNVISSVKNALLADKDIRQSRNRDFVLEHIKTNFLVR